MAAVETGKDVSADGDPHYKPPKRYVPLHERGYGAKCLKCEDKCSGFDLHFWRKICKNCKCPMEEHDVKEVDDDVKKIIGRLFPEKDNFEHLYRRLPGGLGPDQAKGVGGSPGRRVKVNGVESSVGGVGGDGGGDRKSGSAGVEATAGEHRTSSPAAGKGSGGDGKASVPDEVYTWTPSGITGELAWYYMQSLSQEDRPVEGSQGAVTRMKRLMYQLPDQDQDTTICHDLSEREKEKHGAFVEMFRKDAVGIGHVTKMPAAKGVLHPPPAPLTAGLQGNAAGGRGSNVGVQTVPEQQEWSCARCEQAMHPGEVAVFAERAGPDKCWHPKCFVCSKCNELLVDLIYFYKAGHVYCGRHFADTMKARCAACDELIFAKEYTQAEGQNWHLKHFCCWECDTPLGGHRYVAKDNHPYCLQCYQTKLAKVCHTCKRKITADALRLSYEPLDWHATPECFHCTWCEKSLINEPFMCKEGMIFCSVECKRKMLPPSSSSRSGNTTSTTTTPVQRTSQQPTAL